MSLAAIGIAIHAAEAAAKLEDLSHATGVSVETLSKLAAVGHMIAPDLNIEDIAKSLGRMNRQIVIAATASNTTITPFQRLGISVKDASGNVKSGEEIFAEIGDKFSNMQDGALKSGLAMEIFGRSGASIIPVLDEGGERLREFTQLAEKLGAVIDTQTAEAAHKFKENIGTLELAGQGLENQLMKGLLPALTTITDAFVKGLEDPHSRLNTIIDDVVTLTKVFVSAGVVFSKALGVLAGELRVIEDEYGGLIGATERLMHADFSGAWGTMRKGVSDAIGDQKTLWNVFGETKNLIAGIWGPFKVEPLPKRPQTASGVNLESNAARQAELTIQAQIQKLEGQAEAEGLLANAISSVSSATIEATAHAEALRTISTLNAQAQKEGISVTAAQAQQIEAATQRLEAYKSALNINKELQGQIDKVRLSTASLLELAAAYGKGGDAVLAAQEKEKLAPLADKVSDLQGLFDKLKSKPVTGKLAEELITLGSALDQAKAKLQDATAALHEEDLAKYTGEIEKEQAAIAGSLPLLESLYDAYLINDQAVREAKVALEEYNYELAHPGMTVKQKDDQKAIFEEHSKIAHDSQIAEEAGQYSLQRILGDTNSKYQSIRETIEASGQSTLLVDAAIYEANERILRQWDDWALKVGNLHQKFLAFLNELILQGQNLGQKIFGSVLQAVDSLEGELAKLVTGQKTNFSQIGKQLEESIAKATFQSVIGKAASGLEEKLGIKLPGLHGKAGEDPNNPLFVKIVNGSSGPGGAGGGGGFFGDILGKIFGGKSTSSSDNGLGLNLGPMNDIAKILAPVTGPNGETAAAGGGFLSSVGGFFGKLFSAFGGGMADGGDMEPGKWYVTGERHPEIIAPKRPMSVYASGAQMTGTYGGGGTTVVNHFHDVHDMNTFKHSEAQIAGHYQRAMYAAHARNG